MWQLINQYPYLFVVLLGLPPVLLGFALAPSQRRMMLIGGALLAALSPLLYLYEGNYWNPPRLIGTFVGIEDVIMNFSIGSLMWLFAAGAVRQPVCVSLEAKTFFLRIGALSCLGLASMLVLSWLGLGIMLAGLVTGFAITAMLILLRPHLRALLPGIALLYAPYYYLVLYTAGTISDTLFAMWNGPELTGLTLAGLPIEELIWPFSFAAYPVAIAFAANATITPEAKPKRIPA